MKHLSLSLIILFSLLMPASNTWSTPRPSVQAEQQEMESLNLQLNLATQQVKAIINQPVTALPHGIMPVATYKPGWFHDGAIKPDYAHIDVRTTQEFPYKGHEFVASPINKGLMFRGEELEFNANTKYFYTDRTVPKKKLTEVEMLEINRLYRIIGECETKIAALKLQQEAITPENLMRKPNFVIGLELFMLCLFGGVIYWVLFKRQR